MSLIFLATSMLLSCAESDHSDGWQEMSARSQDVQDIQKMGDGTELIGVTPGWFVHDIPLEMVRDLIGDQEVDTCLRLAPSGSFCRMSISPCLSIVVNIEPAYPPAFAQLNTEACRAATDQSASGWTIATKFDGDLVLEVKTVARGSTEFLPSAERD